METNTAEDLCRCCHSQDSLESMKSLNSYSKCREKTFAMMIIETFNIRISPTTNTSLFCICEDCIHKLHDAATFKQSVVECEEKFYKMLNSQDKDMFKRKDVKIEVNTDGVEYNTNQVTATDVASDLPVKYELNDEFEETIEHVTDNEGSHDSFQELPGNKYTVMEEENTQSSDDPVRKPRKNKILITTVSKKVKFKCSLCPKSFAQQRTLEKHLKMNQHSETLICDICGMSLRNKRILKLHLKTHERTYPCEKCTKSFQLEKQLLVHKHARHMGDKPFSCTHCQKHFTRQCSLVKHIRTHTNERPFKCKLCDKSFKETGQLKKHTDITHNRIKKKCPICSKQVGYLTMHMTAVHSDDKPYVCTVCDKKFTMKKYLVDHSRTHTGERPYVCDVCGRRFTQPSVLASHRARKRCANTAEK